MTDELDQLTKELESIKQDLHKEQETLIAARARWSSQRDPRPEVDHRSWRDEVVSRWRDEVVTMRVCHVLTTQPERQVSPWNHGSKHRIIPDICFQPC